MDLLRKGTPAHEGGTRVTSIVLYTYDRMLVPEFDGDGDGDDSSILERMTGARSTLDEPWPSRVHASRDSRPSTNRIHDRGPKKGRR